MKDTSPDLGNYYAAPRMEVKEVSWGRKLGNNEVQQHTASSGSHILLLEPGT